MNRKTAPLYPLKMVFFVGFLLFKQFNVFIIFNYTLQLLTFFFLYVYKLYICIVFNSDSWNDLMVEHREHLLAVGDAACIMHRDTDTVVNKHLVNETVLLDVEV